MSDETRENGEGAPGQPLGDPTPTGDESVDNGELRSDLPTQQEEPVPEAEPLQKSVKGHRVVAAIAIALVVVPFVGERLNLSASPSTETFSPSTIPAVSDCATEIAHTLDALADRTMTTTDVAYRYGAVNPKAQSINRLYRQLESQAFQYGIAYAEREIIKQIGRECEQFPEWNSVGE